MRSVELNFKEQTQLCAKLKACKPELFDVIVTGDDTLEPIWAAFAEPPLAWTGSWIR